MKKINSIYPLMVLICAFFLAFPAYSSAPRGLSRALQSVTDVDTVRNVWVFFNDRPSRGGHERVSERTAQRRLRAKYRAGDNDRPVHRPYISEVQRLGGRLRHEFPWENAASFSVHASILNDIAALPFVRSVEPVAIYTGRNPVGGTGLPRSATMPALPVTPVFDPGYGWHMEMVNIPMAHAYIEVKELGNPGDGAFIAFLDAGFQFDHVVFALARDSGFIAAGWDFVDNDSTVYAPDSVLADTSHSYRIGYSHGTQVAALAVGHYPGRYIGGSWGARFAAARTEDVGIEARIEEDNWAAAVIWAESLGVDIISSSLGYRDKFTDSTENYTWANMDGRTTIVARAASGAVERGMIVVNSAGNESLNANSTRTLTSPADAEGVTAVGAVDRSRITAWFSSAGPTADGRTKPDLSAPGLGVMVVNAYDSTAYTHSNGTSFSVPIVSAIFALILQAYPGISADEARERLYASCAFAQRQTFVDNRHGRGIPNALRAIMQDDEIFIRIIDTTGQPVLGAQVRAGGNVYTSNESGYLLINARTYALPLEMSVSYRGDSLAVYTVNALPFEGIIDIPARRDSGLKISPSIVRKSNVVKGRYYFTGPDFSTPAVAVVRTLNGREVWREKIQLRPDGSAEFIWDGRRRSKRVASGMYFVTVRHGNNQVSGRVIISD
jgi:hypothetical protein